MVRARPLYSTNYSSIRDFWQILLVGVHGLCANTYGTRLYHPAITTLLAELPKIEAAPTLASTIPQFPTSNTLKLAQIDHHHPRTSVQVSNEPPYILKRGLAAGITPGVDL